MTDTLYHVYMKWTPANDNTQASNGGRNMITFKSRQDADEYFRFCLTANVPGTTNLMFATLIREGPQFWAFDNAPAAGHAWDLPRYVIEWFPKMWGSICMPTLLSDYNDRRIWNALDVQAASDWINGGAVFIRNKLVTSEYWYTQDSSIWISTTGRTKFIIRGTAFGATDPQVLIRSDKVTIEVAANASTANPLYVSQSTTDSKLVLSNTSYEWTFKDLFNSFGVQSVTNTTGDTHFEVIHSPGTSVVWDLV